MRKIFSFHYYYCYDYYYFKSGKNEAPMKDLPVRNITEVLPNSFFSLNSLRGGLFDVKQTMFPTCTLNGPQE